MRDPLPCSKVICACLCLVMHAGLGNPALAQTPSETSASSTPDEEDRQIPPSAEAALKQAEEAYEQGDVPLQVESARVVTDGTLRASKEQRAQALRLLGIGLYVTGRIQGAQTAFEQLMQLAPDTRLNPNTTRPEIVTFFYQIRRSRIEELRQAHDARRPHPVLCLLPPTGQFLNGENVKGWVILIAETATFITAAATYLIPNSWRQGDGTACKPGVVGPRCRDLAETYNKWRTVHEVSSAAFGLTYAYGAIDALIGRTRQPSEEELLRRSPHRVSVALLPNGAALSLRF